MPERHPYSLEEIEKHIYNQLIDAHCRYKYMVEVVFPLLNQNALRTVYPGILTRMQCDSYDGVILGLSKLIDNSREPRLIHFKRFIETARLLSEDKIMNKDKWKEFLNVADSFLGTLDAMKRKLAPLRNKFCVHISPMHPDAPEPTTWEYWRKILEKMEEIFNLYQIATKDAATGQFWTTNMDFEPKNFLKWCRLDNFEKHRADELENRRRQLLNRA